MFPFHNHSGSWLDELCPYRAGRLWAQQASCSPRQLVTLAKVPLLVIVFSVPRTQAAHTESFPPRTKCRHLRFDASIPARPLDSGAPRQSRAHWIRPVIPGRSRSWRLFPRSYVARRLRRASFLVVSVSCARPRDAEEINSAATVERRVTAKEPMGTIEAGLCVTLLISLTIMHETRRRHCPTAFLCCFRGL